MRTLPVIPENRDAPSTSVDAKTGEFMVSERTQPGLFGPFPFFGFSYSFREITLVDGLTRVRSHQTRLIDGKLQTEEFEGTLGGAAYAHAIAQTQHLFAEQTAFFLRQFSRFLPFWGK